VDVYGIILFTYINLQ
jgi:hypothetical protein